MGLGGKELEWDEDINKGRENESKEVRNTSNIFNSS